MHVLPAKQRPLKHEAIEDLFWSSRKPQAGSRLKVITEVPKHASTIYERKVSERSDLQRADPPRQYLQRLPDKRRHK